MKSKREVMLRLTSTCALFICMLAGSTVGCAQTSADQAERASTLEEELAPAGERPTQDTLPQIRVEQAISSSRRNAIVLAAERVAPAVVSVHVVRRARVQPRTMFERMFIPPGYEREIPGLGSGFIIRRNGLVITNEHVVRGAGEVVVTLGDGREFDADVVGTDEVNDLAVVRMRLSDGDQRPIAALGDSDELMIGEWVIAIGNPFGFLLSNTEPTVTAGVISAVGRDLIPASALHGGTGRAVIVYFEDGGRIGSTQFRIG